MICEPKGGWRPVEVTERRTAVDFAHQMRWLVDEAYPDAQVVRLVLDNLNTHKLGSLYEAFEPCEARRIAQRLEFHYTPTHGSWLNMAEIELSVFSRGCLNRRISDEPELRREVAALERERNAAKSAIDWRFTSQDAPRKLLCISTLQIRRLTPLNGTRYELKANVRKSSLSASPTWGPLDSVPSSLRDLDGAVILRDERNNQLQFWYPDSVAGDSESI